MIKTTFHIFMLLSSLISCGFESSEDQSKERIEAGTLKPIVNDTPVQGDNYIKCVLGTPLNYRNFGEGFMLTHCTSCHSQYLKDEQRNGATLNMNFDSPENIIQWTSQIIASAASPTGNSMPPVNYIDVSQRMLLLEWLECGGNTGYDRIKPE